jgi:hypothetical protein
LTARYQVRPDQRHLNHYFDSASRARVTVQSGDAEAWSSTTIPLI